jgi:D-tyrosyl-tRNA(Tyr) deacylase
MRAVVQRVTGAAVIADGIDRGRIASGLCVFVGVGRDDGEKDAGWLAAKIAGLRIFEDGDGKMNLNIAQIGGSLLIVSQFTLYGDCRKGLRPSYDAAMPARESRALYDVFVDCCARTGAQVVTGVFQADMKVSIENDGPVTLMLDSKKNF